MTSHFVTLPDVRVHYLWAGEGPPLLLLHGTALDSSRLSYAEIIPELAKQFTVIALDWPGYGESDKPALEYSMDFYYRVLCDFVEQLGFDDFALAAFSMGGGVALKFALKQPERVSRLILINSYALGGAVHLPFAPRLALRLPGVADFIWRRLGDNRLFLSLCLRYLVYGHSRRVTPALISEVKEQLSVEGLQFAFMTWLRRELGNIKLATNYKLRLLDLQIPTLLIHGSRDLIIPAYRSRRAAKLIPNAELCILKGCGHWTPREAPTKVFEAIREFL